MGFGVGCGVGWKLVGSGSDGGSGPGSRSPTHAARCPTSRAGAHYAPARACSRCTMPDRAGKQPDRPRETGFPARPLPVRPAGGADCPACGAAHRCGRRWTVHAPPCGPGHRRRPTSPRPPLRGYRPDAEQVQAPPATRVPHPLPVAALAQALSRPPLAMARAGRRKPRGASGLAGGTGGRVLSHTRARANLDAKPGAFGLDAGARMR